jgi:hypothetical protein
METEPGLLEALATLVQHREALVSRPVEDRATADSPPNKPP